MENNVPFTQQSKNTIYPPTLLQYDGSNLFMNNLYQPDNAQGLGTSPQLVLDHSAKYEHRQDDLFFDSLQSKPEREEEKSNVSTSPEINYQHRNSVPMIPTPNIRQASGRRRNTEGILPKYTTLSEEKDSEELKKQRGLERNRQAALKCRQRKKQWIADLQNRVEFLSTDNDHLQQQAEYLREEIINLKTLLLAHKDCKVAQNGIIPFQQIHYFNPNTAGRNGLPSPPPTKRGFNMNHHPGL